MDPLILCRFVQTSAAVLFAGTAALRLLASGTGLERFAPWRRLAWGSWWALVAAGLVQLWLTAAVMSGQAINGEVLRGVLAGTSFGAIWKVRALLLAGLLVFRRWLLAAALLVTLVWGGHTQASAHWAWLLPVDVLHVLAAGAWPGGLLPLALLLRRARNEPALLPAATAVARRFSRLSLAAVAVLALSGSLNAVGLTGSFSALWTSVYGRLILCKVALLAAMIVFGAMNRQLVRQGPEMALRELVRNLVWECALAAAVLLATETLAMNAPPAAGG